MSDQGFGFYSTADEVLDGMDLSGKVVLITGGNTGLGAETARSMAARGADVIITARTCSRADEVVSSIKAATGKTIEVGELELDSLVSIREFAEDFLARHPRLHILINNAGVMACPEGKTRDGFELQFGTNHLGHFLLTCLLAPALIDAAPSRVVNLSSFGHTFAPVCFDDIHFEYRDYDKILSYGQSKTANVLFTVALEKKLADKGVRAFAVHPGLIPTDLSRHMNTEEFKSAPRGSERTAKTVAQGAATTVYAATTPDLEGKGGLYLANCQICSVDDESESHDIVRSYAIDPASADLLWNRSEEMVGQTFRF